MNKELFNQLFKNKILNKLIFNNVYDLNKVINPHGHLLFKWDRLIRSPHVLARYRYIDLIKRYFSKHQLNDIHYNIKYHFIHYVIRDNDLELFKYIVEELLIICPIIKLVAFYTPVEVQDLLYFAAKYAKLEIIKYLETSYAFKLVKWDYNAATAISALSGDLPTFRHLALALIKNNKLSTNSSSNINEIDSVSILKHISLSGNIEMYKWFLNNINNSTISHAILLNEAINGGHLEFIQYYISSNNINSETIVDDRDNEILLLDRAASKNRLDILGWLHENNIGSCSTKAMDSAVYNFNYEMIKWLHENRTEGCTTDAMDNINPNDFNMIKWFHENRTEGCTTLLMDICIMHRVLDTVKWLHQNRTEGCSEDAMGYAAENNDLEMVKWIHENYTNQTCINVVIENAFQGGYLDILKFIYYNVPNESWPIWDSIIDMECFKFVMEEAKRTEGCTTLAMDNAAHRNNFEMVKWLHENRTEGCSQWALYYAVLVNNLEMSKWLAENRTEGCNQQTIELAASKGHFEILKWLIDNGYSSKKPDPRVLDKAAKSNNLEMVRYLYSNGFTFLGDSQLDSYSLEMMKLIFQLNPSDLKTNSVTETAIIEGKLDIVKWLCDTGRSRFHQSAIEKAIRYHCFEAIRLLLQYGTTCRSIIINIMKYHIINAKYQDIRILYVNQLVTPFDALLASFECNEIDSINWIFSTGDLSKEEFQKNESRLDKYKNTYLYTQLSGFNI